MTGGCGGSCGWPHNASAIALYRRNGFGETGVSSEPESDGTGCEILMAKPLDGPAG